MACSVCRGVEDAGRGIAAASSAVRHYVRRSSAAGSRPVRASHRRPAKRHESARSRWHLHGWRTRCCRAQATGASLCRADRTCAARRSPDVDAGSAARRRLRREAIGAPGSGARATPARDRRGSQPSCRRWRPVGWPIRASRRQLLSPTVPRHRAGSSATQPRARRSRSVRRSRAAGRAGTARRRHGRMQVRRAAVAYADVPSREALDGCRGSATVRPSN